jgi:hypothetical protein
MKLTNEYIQLLGPLYEETPKALLGALVVSLLSRQLEGSCVAAEIQSALLDEWSALHANGIVPQKPRR